MKTLNSRTRLLITLRHEEPDRIPIDLGATYTTGIHVLVYRDLRKLLGLPLKPIRVYDFYQQLAEVEKEVLELFHIDVIGVNRTLEPAFPMEHKFKVWIYRDGTPLEIPADIDIVKTNDGYYAYRDNNLIGIMPLNGYYFWGLDRSKHMYPLGNVKTVDDVKKHNWEQYKVKDNNIEMLRKQAEYLYKTTDYGLVFFGCGSLHEWGQGLRGWSTWLSDLRLRKVLAEAILDHMIDVIMYNVKRIIDAIGRYINVIGFGDDLGTEEGPQISNQTFREFYRHRWEEIFSYVKKHSKAYIFFHSCGSIFPLIKELIDIGVDILNPVQISAKGMDPEKLKKEYGEQITFWGGGVDTQHILPFSSPQEVAEHVKKLIKIFAPGGGFVYASVHNIQPNTPAENVLTAFKTAYEYGRYPIR